MIERTMRRIFTNARRPGVIEDGGPIASIGDDFRRTRLTGETRKSR